jgi:23S rRNA-intervening sequence protein
MVSIGPPLMYLREQQDHRIKGRWKSRDAVQIASVGCLVKDFQELKVWQKPHELILAVYQVTARFPREELYGLTTKMRRAGTSIAANLAEGCGRTETRS